MFCKNCGRVPKVFRVSGYYVCYGCGFTGAIDIENALWEQDNVPVSATENEGVKLIKRSLSENRNKSS